MDVNIIMHLPRGQIYGILHEQSSSMSFTAVSSVSFISVPEKDLAMDFAILSSFHLPILSPPLSERSLAIVDNIFSTLRESAICGTASILNVELPNSSS